MNCSLGFLVNGRIVFGAVIPLVIGSWGPEESELALGFAAADPPQAHVHGFYAIGYGGEFGDANSISVVSLQGSLRLRLFHFYGSVAQVYYLLGGNI